MTDESRTEGTRVYFTGTCEGFAELREALAGHPEIEVVGSSEHVGQASAALAGGHLDCVVHAARTDAFPATEVAAIREQTRTPIIVIAAGQGGGLLEEALEANVADGNAKYVRVVARNVLVLKAPTQNTGSKVSGTGTSVTLAVSERYQAQKIFFTYANEDHWSLQLRPVVKAIDSPEDLETANTLRTDNNAKHVKVGK